MADVPPIYDPDDPDAVALLAGAIQALPAAGVAFLVGGAYAFARYTGIARHTKDWTCSSRRPTSTRRSAALDAAGFRTEVTYTHWLAKAFRRGTSSTSSSGPGTGRPRWTTGGSRTRRRGRVRGAGQALPGRGIDLVEGVRHGAEPVRRGGHRTTSSWARGTG